MRGKGSWKAPCSKTNCALAMNPPRPLRGVELRLPQRFQVPLLGGVKGWVQENCHCGARQKTLTGLFLRKMKKLVIAMAALLASVSAYGQGQVVFNNHVVGSVVAQVTWAGTTSGIQDGVGVPNNKFEAQLFGGPAGGPLEALLPKTTFRTGAGAGFVVPVDVILPKVAPGTAASLQMRVVSTIGMGAGASKVFNVTLGGGLNPPANLVGLEAFSVCCVPEPSTIALGVLGAAGLLALRRRK
jgi:hypothetical protein